ncbi:MAG: phosphoadenylyl-sulfate reductase [Limnohabitans sp.]
MSQGVTSSLRPAQTASAPERLAQPSADFAAKLAETEALLQEAARDWQPLTQASSLGAEDVVITHLIGQLALEIPVFVLDTGALHTETLALLERTLAFSPVPVQVHRPETSQVLALVRAQGQDGIYQSQAQRKACCQVRKMVPLAQALAGQRAWITGLRREQSSARAEVPLIDDSELSSKGLTKFNPLANWTWGDVWHYIAQNQVDYNPLHDRFFPSIGCAPCTRAIAMGEDFRAGRWWWEDDQQKECGLHAR